MQINEELVRQITNAVLSQMSHTGSSSVSGDALPASSSVVPSMAGRDRINEEKTDYSGYPRAQKGTDPKEVVIGVGAAFQREIKRTICDILRFRHRRGHPVQGNDGHPPERPLPALQPGAVPAGAAHDPGDLPPDRAERRKIRQRRAGRPDPVYE